MVMSRSEINEKSNEKRNVVSKTYKLKRELVERIEKLSTELDMPQSKIIEKAIGVLEQNESQKNNLR